MRFVKGFEKEILAALNSADPRIHYNAVEAAGNWELDAAWPHIARLVTSPKTEKLLRLAAIWAAASIRPHESNIIEPLVDSYDEDISEAAMDALTEAGFAGEWEEEEEDEDYCFEEDQDEDEEDSKK
jgi:HEAT repeat protein